MIDFSDTVIVTDLDGTYFGRGSETVPRNTEALRWFEERGGFFTVATGRIAPNLAHDLKETALLINAPVSACNGTCLYDIGRGLILAENPMDREEAWALIRFMDEHYPQIGVRISVPDGFLTSPENLRANPMISAEYSRLANAAGHLEPRSAWDGYTWYKLVYRDRAELLAEVRRDIIPLFGDRLTISNSGATFLEIQRGGISKASLLPEVRRYCQEKSGRPVRTVCCGDYENDREMLLAADLAVCPANADSSVREVADLIMCRHDEGLMADVVEHLAAQKGQSVRF
jgi:HAD superfamily hydrolase (TIGR01484 family)